MPTDVHMPVFVLTTLLFGRLMAYVFFQLENM